MERTGGSDEKPLIVATKHICHTFLDVFQVVLYPVVTSGW